MKTSHQRELVLIPCCAKKDGGHCSSPTTSDPLNQLVSGSVYSGILEARKSVLLRVRQSEKYLSDSYEKNLRLKLGPDFGGQCASGQYLSAVDRYKGTLYTYAPALSSWDRPDIQILILSALYGPLHPLSRIQDYNLQMGDEPASKVWKRHFARFLRDYVLLNEIQSIHLFFGTSTHYLKVAGAAVKPLLNEKLIKEATQYHVISGNTRLTPKTHGELLENYLKQGRIDQLPENMEARTLNER